MNNILKKHNKEVSIDINNRKGFRVFVGHERCFEGHGRCLYIREVKKYIKSQNQQLYNKIMDGRDLEKRRTNALCNSVIMVAGKFIHKCETGRARSVETRSDMAKIKIEAELLKDFLNQIKE